MAACPANVTLTGSEENEIEYPELCPKTSEPQHTTKPLSVMAQVCPSPELIDTGLP